MLIKIKSLQEIYDTLSPSNTVHSGGYFTSFKREMAKYANSYTVAVESKSQKGWYKAFGYLWPPQWIQGEEDYNQTKTHNYGGFKTPAAGGAFKNEPTPVGHCVPDKGIKLSPKPASKPAAEPCAFTEFLQNAIDLEKQRGVDYDSPDGERSAARIAEAFNAITGYDLTESEVWLILSLLKQVRQWSNEAFHRDSAEDQVTYVALMSESLAAGKKSTKR